MSIATDLTVLLRSWADRLTRKQRRLIQVLVDVVLIGLCALLAFKLRLGFGTELTFNQNLAILIAPLVSIPVFIRLGMYRAVLRYLPDMALIAIFQAVALSFLIWAFVLFILGNYDGLGAPRSVPFIFLVLLFSGTALSRFAAKRLIYLGQRESRRRLAIFGAGQHGLEYCAALIASGDVEVCALFDDDRAKQGREFYGVRVHSPAMIGDLARRLGFETIVLCMPKISGQRRLELAASLVQLKVQVQTLPSLSALLAGRSRLEPIEDIDLNELLGRSPVPPDLELMRQAVAGKRVLVTGAGGSVGGELVRTLLAQGARSIVAVDHSEPSLFNITQAAQRDAHNTDIEPVLASVLDRSAMKRVFEKFRPDIVYHAAAYKHVGLAEKNVTAVFENNVIGTKTLLEVVADSDVETFVLISTDKAVNPTSVMGATKRLAEFMIRWFAHSASGKGTKFVAVRFGNVAGSQGSVIPIFREQIRNGGPVTVRGRDTNRYFMALSEASELIVQAGGLADGGEIFLLQMGEPVAIYNLARAMIGLSGLTVRDADNPDGDIEIEITQIEPGEKVSEELVHDPSNFAPTSHPKIVKAAASPQPEGSTMQELEPLIENIRTQTTPEAMRDALMAAIGAIQSPKRSAEPQVIDLAARRPVR